MKSASAKYNKEDIKTQENEEEIKSAGQIITPMMQQYLAVKKNYPGSLLFYRMGDFYELFFEDAVTAAAELDIVLTRRGEYNGQSIPMCGVPHHSHESYLNKLIKKGYKAAICEQVETPEEAKKQRGYKAVVKREVIRVVTPATIIEDNLLEGFSANYLVGLHKSDNKNYILGYADISTGEFNILNITKEKLYSEIEKLSPKELLISEEIFSDKEFAEIFSSHKKIISNFENSLFSAKRGEEKIRNFYGLKTVDSLNLLPHEIGLCGVILDYISSTQPAAKPNILFPRKTNSSEFMEIDISTMNNLEIFRANDGTIKNSVFGSINRSATSCGARFLQKALSKPLLNKNEINKRLELVEYFYHEKDLRNKLRELLKTIPDIERIISRIHFNRSNPRDLEALKHGLRGAFNINFLLEQNKITKLTTKNNNDEIMILLDEAIIDQAPQTISDGNFIKENYNAKLDDYRKTKDNSVNILNNLLEKYRSETGIQTLKVKNNNVLGFFLEITPTQSEKVPTHFIHRQTLAGNIRYTTTELREIENKIINSESYAISLEQEIYRDICSKIIARSDDILETATMIAQIDFFTSLAELAEDCKLTKPDIDESTDFILKDARHLVVEKNRNDYTPNDISLSDNNKIWLITGPNMSGKSTYLRQNAIIAVLAQIGSFVPVSHAKIGIVDKVFSRVGASDNIAKGQSTFMVEMVETASILNNATERSFVILDEIGRGTSTYDGISIAWSVLEFIHNQIKCRTLFATHYHELTSLTKRLKNISLHTTEIKEWNGEILFLHKIIEGISGKSYGLNVAKLAGIPNKVISRAEQILKILEEKNKSNPSEIFSDDLPLFSSANNDTKNIQEKNFSLKENSITDSNFYSNNEVISEIENLNLDEITPLKALNLIHIWKNKL